MSVGAVPVEEEDPPIPEAAPEAPSAENPAAPAVEAPPVVGAAPAPAPEAAPPLGAPEIPEVPALTGDAAKDILALQAHRDVLEKHRSALFSAKGAAQQAQAEQEAKLLEERLKREQEERERYENERALRHQQIEDSIKERMAAAGDIEGAKHPDQYTGAQLASLVAGGIGAAFQNMAAAQVGGVGHAENGALTAINAKLERDNARRQQRLKMADDSLLQARYGFKEAGDNHRAALNDIDADAATKHLLIAAEAEQRLKRLGATQAQIDANAIVADQKQKAAEKIDQIHGREDSRDLQAKGQQERMLYLRATLGEKKAEHADALTEKQREFDEKKAGKTEKQKADDEETVVRDEQGNPYARVQKGRGGVLGFADQDKRYQRALTALEQLKARKGVTSYLPKGSEWDNAVLAIASTTNANPSDATTKHEAGTLTSKSGLVDNAAIDRKIEEIKKAQETYRHEALRPLSGEERKRMGTSPAAAPASAAAPKYPIGTRAKTKAGQPVVMTADGWQPAP